MKGNNNMDFCKELNELTTADVETLAKKSNGYKAKFENLIESLPYSVSNELTDLFLLYSRAQWGLGFRKDTK